MADDTPDLVLRRLADLDPSSRRQWLLDHQPVGVSPFHWWLGLIEAAVQCVRYRWAGWRFDGPAVDMEVVALLVECALGRGLPLVHAVDDLVLLSRSALEAGYAMTELPAILRPDEIAQRTLGGFPMSRQEAADRAAHLRSITLTEDDFVRPGEDIAVSLRDLSGTDEYRSARELLDMERALTRIAPIVDLIVDAGLAAEVRAWRDVVPDLETVSESWPTGLSG
ncbi:hypothetical protein [Actinomadura fibrosa]|uniref:Uncharacterized protein n=1 Tax=Actinomadura fibrosa TaxID=111802 RepID=A0ABW2Y2M1_9ACTN|nr:hypothetical protein [Actinomadura fibrosa]